MWSSVNLGQWILKTLTAIYTERISIVAGSPAVEGDDAGVDSDCDQDDVGGAGGGGGVDYGTLLHFDVAAAAAAAADDDDDYDD